MSYTINKTDGSVLAVITDGNIDQTTSLTLIGKSASAYGEYINENLVHLLENFANSTQPSGTPLAGQLWFDTIESRLKVYDGNGYKVAGGTIVSKVLPSSIAQGDIWINQTNGQLWFNDGVETILAGPQKPAVTGFNVITVLGDNQISYTVIKVVVGTKLIAILSNDSFLIDTNNLIPDYPYVSIEQGINLVSVAANTVDEVKPIITNIRTATGDYDAVNNERLSTAIKQYSPYAISLDISSLHGQLPADQNTKIGRILDNLFPYTDYSVTTDILPTCRVLCTDQSLMTIRTFKLEGTHWVKRNDTISVSYE